MGMRLEGSENLAREYISLLVFGPPLKRCYVRFTVYILRRFKSAVLQAMYNTKFNIFWLPHEHIARYPSILSSYVIA